MAFEKAPDSETAESTTVAEYSVLRLGRVPYFRVRYAETIADGVNAFGTTAQRKASTGREWELALAADTPERTQFMGQLITGIMMDIGSSLLTTLGLQDQVSEAELLAAVMARDNVDAFIASAFEGLERQRRLGQAPLLMVVGQAPAETPPVE